MSRRTNGEGSIISVVRNGKKYYRGIITVGFDVDGKQKRKTFSSSKKSEVVKKMNDFKATSLNNYTLEKENLTFGEWYKTWVELYKKGKVQNNTLEGYLADYRNKIEYSFLDKTKVKDITLDDLQKFYNNLEKNFTPNQIKKLYIKINSCLESAVLNNFALKNYSKGVVLKKIEVKQDKMYKVFTLEEQKKILEFLDLEFNEVDRVIFFTFYTGLRLGEVLAIRWGKIKDNTLEISEQYQRDTLFLENGSRKTIYTFKEILKTDSSKRKVPLPKPAINLLKTLQKGQKEDLVFRDKNGDPIERKKPDRRVKTICKKLAIPERNFHSIRHTYATRLFEGNVPIKTVQTLLGHSKVEMTLNIYTHVMPYKKEEAVEVLNNIFK